MFDRHREAGRPLLVAHGGAGSERHLQACRAPRPYLWTHTEEGCRHSAVLWTWPATGPYIAQEGNTINVAGRTRGIDIATDGN